MRQAFVRQRGGEYRYFHKLQQGQPLFVVTYGAFSGRAAAQAAISALPAKLQAGKPWPRSSPASSRKWIDALFSRLSGL